MSLSCVWLRADRSVPLGMNWRSRPLVFSLLLLAALGASLGANVYLFSLVVSWQDAWLEQILTTSMIERL